jgi:macrolide transport system ATP-binding/permease protein
MRQKILLSAALLHDPEVLILDEPFSGLDVTSALMLRSLLRALAAEGKMILYSSHVLEVVEKICSDVVILRKGEVVAYDSIDRLRELMSQPSLEGVFSQLAQVDDGDLVASRIVEVMKTGSASTRLPPPPPPDAPSGPDRTPAKHFSDLGQDIRYSFRQLAHSPGFTAVALISLSLGICIATCALSEMNGMVLRSVPGVENPSDLAALQLPTSYPSYKHYRDNTAAFSSAMAYVAPVPFAVSLGNATERKWGQLVTPSYFSTLGVHPQLGHFFDMEDEPPGGAPRVVVSYRFWEQHLASAATVIGTTLRINSQLATVIGVGPKDFLGASPLLAAADLWMPISSRGSFTPELADNALERRDRAMFRIVGRLKPGVTMTGAEAELDTEAQQLEQDNGDPNRNRKGRRITLVEGGKLLPLRKQDLPFFTSFLTIMASLVMLIACANVANLMFARAAARSKEIAIRLSLGARRSRIVRQLLTESMILSAGAAIPGYLASVWLMGLSSQMKMPLTIPVSFDFRPDWRVLLFTTALTALTGLACGLLPALQATRLDLNPALKEGGSVAISGHRRFTVRNLLMVSQLAGSLTLLAVLGILAFGIQTTLGVQSGFDPKNLYLISLDPIRDGSSPEQAATFLQKLVERIKAQPSVLAASLTESVPVSLGGLSASISTPNGESNLTLNAVRHVVGKDYFETTGIKVLSGRSFRSEDDAAATIVVSRELESRLWNHASGLGRGIETGNGEIVPAKVLPGTYDYRARAGESGRNLFRVVGVVSDVAEGLIVGKPRPAVYSLLRLADYSQPAPEGLTLIIRGVPGADIIRTVTEEIRAIDPNIKPFNPRSMTDQIGRFMAPLQGASWTYGLIGIFGLVLASVGLAGMTAYSVAQRAREIGIRVALGAQSKDVVRLVMGEGLVLIAAGTALGLLGAWAGGRLLSAMNSSVGQVTSTSTSNPIVLLGSTCLLAALALFACYLPARKSLNIDPAVTLRQD